MHFVANRILWQKKKKNVKNIHSRDFSENQWIVNNYSYFSSQDTMLREIQIFRKVGLIHRSRFYEYSYIHFNLHWFWIPHTYSDLRWKIRHKFGSSVIRAKFLDSSGNDKYSQALISFNIFCLLSKFYNTNWYTMRRGIF